MKIVQQFHEENENVICSHCHIYGKQPGTHAVVAFHHIFLHQFQNLLSIHQYQTFHEIQVHEVGILRLKFPVNINFNFR